jgi:hypothetical protein
MERCRFLQPMSHIEAMIRTEWMTSDIGMEYDLWYADQYPPLEVQNFCKLLAASDEKVHDGTDLTVVQAVTCFMAMKSKYNFSNQCYNNIMNLIIYLIPMKHNMLKDLYQSKKIIAGLGMSYEKIYVYEKNCMLFCKEHKFDTECMHYGRSKYMKVVNEDRASITTKVAVKQLHFTLRLKRLYVSEETAKHMRWHKDGKHDG